MGAIGDKQSSFPPRLEPSSHAIPFSRHLDHLLLETILYGQRSRASHYHQVHQLQFNVVNISKLEYPWQHAEEEIVHRK